ncbi:GNAT family N-acetyltransferase [Psychrilyobacter atlanticus]|uniref:GNAT family N-acetyltransferase n=1 Tax=Psychrilyobacter atlanticus TaxID=271091 RepID=UPI00041B9BA8|nr:GNAT family N-acetyltransferase [Psychrilyobacter atlanticus]
MTIKEVPIEKILTIRKEVMWPDKDINFVKVEGDDKAIHLGVYENNKVVSIVSLYITKNSLQFRKFATLKSQQKKGYGTLLLKEVFKLAANKNINYIWCNARKNKISFYERFGLISTGKEFLKSGKSYVIMERSF